MEAARAGERVAVARSLREVRNLASRSANAAKEMERAD
ncbi:hypothetical protein ACNKHS_11460 [Shigella flexneri]